MHISDYNKLAMRSQYPNEPLPNAQSGLKLLAKMIARHYIRDAKLVFLDTAWNQGGVDGIQAEDEDRRGHLDVLQELDDEDVP